MEKIFHRLTLSSLFILATGIFTSVSLSALSHILIFVPGIYFSYKLFKEKSFSVPTSFWALFAMGIVGIISVFSNWTEIGSPVKNIIKLKYFFISLISIPALFYTFRDFLKERHIKVLLWTFLLATTVATISGLIAIYTGFNPVKMKAACHADRACGLYGMYMTYGYGISLFMVLLTGAILYKEKFSKYIPVSILYIAWIINFAGLYFSLARGAWFGFLAAIPFFFLKSNKKTFVIVAIICLVSLLGSLASPKVRDMFFKRKGSNNQRIAFWQAAVMAAKEKPFFGYGYRNFEPNVSIIKERYDITYPKIKGHAHNNFLEHLASTGYIGLFALLIFLGFWLRETYLYSPIFFPFTISFLVSGFVQYTFGDGENLFLIMIIWALGCLPKNILSKE